MLNNTKCCGRDALHDTLAAHFIYENKVKYNFYSFKLICSIETQMRKA